MTDPVPTTAAPRGRHVLLKSVIIVLAAGFLAWELYALVPGVRVLCVKVLAQMGPNATPRLLGYLVDEHMDVRAAALDAVQQAGPEAVKPIAEGLTDADPRRRELAA